LLDRPDFLPETSKISYTYFLDKSSWNNLKVDQGHWRWHNSIGNITFLLVAYINRVLRRFRDINAVYVTVCNTKQFFKSITTLKL